MGLLDREIRLFLKAKKVLVYDDKRGSRLEIKRGLIEAGVNPKKIILEKDFKKARQAIYTHTPEIIISEFQVFDDYGLDLARLQMDLLGDQAKKIFIVVTADATQAAVADAAEEEVEAFLIKPVTKTMVADYVYKAASKKINPSAYASMIYEGKKLIKDGNYDLAEQTLTMAKIMYERPMMACYYTGEIYMKQERYTEALEQYLNGLSVNSLHFKCLSGQFMALIALNRKHEAFKVLERLTDNFPLTPSLLKQAFILSITSYHFEEVETYYKQYLRQPRKTDELKHTVSQALLTAGKILLRERRHPQIALNFFKKGSIISGRKENYLNDVIDNLIKEGFPHETDNFFNMFDPEEINSAILERSRFKAFAATMHRYPNDIIERGRKLISAENADEEIYVIVLDLLVKQKRFNLIESVVYKGIEQLPKSKSHFVKYLNAA